MNIRPDQVRRTLLARRQELLRRHAATVSTEQELLEEREPDLPDLAADRTAAALLDRLSDVELVELSRIGRALDRLDDGTWGRCVVCGNPIAPERLRAVPEADRCAGCTNSH